MRKKLLFCVLLLFIINTLLAFNNKDFVISSPVNSEENDLRKNEFLKLLEIKNEQLKINLSGFEIIEYADEICFLAGTTVSFGYYENINATLLSKKQAYQTAYLKANAVLFEGVQGYFLKRGEELKNMYDKNQNIGWLFSGFCKEDVTYIERYSKGYITFDVSEKRTGDVGKVYVSLLITPLTLATVNQLPGIILSTDIKNALNVLFTELNNNLIPLVGRKLIIIPKTNEIVFVAYESELARYSDNPIIRKDNLMHALEVSKLRVLAALLELLYGAELTWTSEVNDFTKTLSDHIFEELKKTEHYELVVKGVLPPGITIKTSWNKSVEEKGYGWVTSVVIYYPSLSLDLSKIGEKSADEQ